jgi:hypothetical protein
VGQPAKINPNDSRSAAIPIKNYLLLIIKASKCFMPEGIEYIPATGRFLPKAAKRRGIRGKGKGRNVPMRKDSGRLEGKREKEVKKHEISYQGVDKN